MTISKQLKELVTNLNFSLFNLSKNTTPRQLAIVTALWIATFTVLLLVPVLLLMPYIQDSSLVTLLIIGFFIFLIAYLIILYALKKYIYRRIKLIYKTIHQRKLLLKEKKEVVDVSKNIFDEVEKEVEAWAQTKENEVQKYKEWAEYRRQFVGDISHELKTPIFIIQSYIDTLLGGSWKNEEVCLKFLQKTERSIERLNSIVQDLEVIAKLESGEMMLDMRVFDIKQLAESVIDELEWHAKKSNVNIQLKEGASKSFKVLADEEKIHQVLTNLLSNSIKYGVENGRTKVSFYDMDQRILIEVSDNGIGISDEHLKHIFDRFYRVDKSRSREGGGSGLGLSIVKHILETHKQSINVRSTPGLGTTFGFTLEKAK